MPADEPVVTATAAVDATTNASNATASATEQLTSFDALGFLVVGFCGSALTLFTLTTAKALADALLELHKHYKRAQTPGFVRPPSRKELKSGAGRAKAAAAGGAGSCADGALKPGWWRGARKLRSKVLTYRVGCTILGWSALLHRGTLLRPVLNALPEEGMALFLLCIVVPLVGLLEHTKPNLFAAFPSLDIDPPPGSEHNNDYWVDD